MDIGNEDKSVILVDSKAATQKASNNANPDDASEPNDYDLLTKVIQGIDKQVGELEAKKDMIADAQIATGPVLAQVCYAVAVNAAEDWPWTALAPIVLGRRFVDQNTLENKKPKQNLTGYAAVRVKDLIKVHRDYPQQQHAPKKSGPAMGGVAAGAVLGVGVGLIGSVLVTDVTYVVDGRNHDFGGGGD
ncbi:hypothetical protein SAPIO_CDS6689 [Scedosporium apiospermum]|uniref:Uncharacterized protein n=1 Tax=Pseudallescheria apiosperma TaxID=563466 RepID=A0A084G3G5_PSEDA|nr:uncharacterized protein SAPIO_CDS6689 [Scedosporium apiospermum]KEZ41877.1 hypothetical protein SAPIO_CDS6689 [Scedosporium apiospermum]